MKKESNHKAAIIFICVLTIPVVIFSLVLFAPSTLSLLFQFGAGIYYTLTAKEDYIVSGTFQSNQDGIDYTLEFKAISKKDYQAYQGENTIQDTSKDRKNRYYYVQLYSEDSQDVVTNYTFLNLKDNRIQKHKAHYEDDNGKAIDYSYNPEKRCRIYLVYLSEDLSIEFNY